MTFFIHWTPKARFRLKEIRDFLASDKPAAAGRLAIRIVSVVEALREHPNLGRLAPKSQSRELVIGGTPYIVEYKIEEKQRRVLVLTVRHGARIHPSID